MSAERGSGRDHDGAVPLAHGVAAAAVSGYFAAGVVVSLLTLACGAAWRLVGHRLRGSENGTGYSLGPPAPHELTEGRLRLLFLGFLLAAAAALPVDCAVSHWCVAGNCPRFVHSPLDVCAVFGHGVMAFVVLVAIYQLDPPRRRMLWWVLACVLLSGLAANGAKMLLARTRPCAFDFQGDVWTTFGGWLPLGGVSQSFPSGHTSTAAGLALPLMMLYPRGRRLFLLLVLLVACQRIDSGAHFLSDVLGGAAVGCLTVACCLRLRRWFSAPAETPG
jgi:membrane-associated phospholipid phosphatase